MWYPKWAQSDAKVTQNGALGNHFQVLLSQQSDIASDIASTMVSSHSKIPSHPFSTIFFRSQQKHFPRSLTNDLYAKMFQNGFQGRVGKWAFSHFFQPRCPKGSRRRQKGRGEGSKGRQDLKKNMFNDVPPIWGQIGTVLRSFCGSLYTKQKHSETALKTNIPELRLL